LEFSERTQEKLREVLCWGTEVLEQIQEVSTDLWKLHKHPQRMMPNAQVVADRFHVMKQEFRVVDHRQRKQEKEPEKHQNQLREKKEV